MSVGFPDLSQSELDRFLAGNEEWNCFSQRLSDLLPETDNEADDSRQTGITVDTTPYSGDFNFEVEVIENSSKNYAFSEKLQRLYCNMDKAVPIKFKWNGPNVFCVRAMVVFKDPDHQKKPVFRCREHNDEKHPNNRDCKHYKHIVRSDNEISFYQENTNSQRHSVVTHFDNDQNVMEGVQAVYRFMCHTTCSGIGRRRTDLVLTLEDSRRLVLGRAVIEVKICSCPRRDKGRDEDDSSTTKKRRSKNDPYESESKKIMKKGIVTNGIESIGATIKRENVDAAGDYSNLQISVPNFPTSKIEEFHSMLVRIVGSFYASDQDIAAVAGNVQVHQV